MGQIEEFSDMTGQMSQDEVNQENISNIIDELNRNSDQLDALNNVLSVIAYGSLTYTWAGTGSGGSPTEDILIAPEISSANFIGLCYMSRSSDASPVYYAMPYTEIYTNANGDTVIGKEFFVNSNSSTGKFEVPVNFYNPGSAETFTFFYILLQQPANTSLS